MRYKELMFVTLDDVCEKGSSNLAQKDILDLDGDFPIFGAAGYIGNANFYHQEKPYLAVVKDGAGVGRVMLLPAKSSVIGTMQYIIPKEDIIVEYLYYAVKAMHLEKYYMGAAIPHIYFKDYKKEKLKLCSKIKQEQIVARLDIIEKIINQHKQQLNNLEKLTKARFIEVFGDAIHNPMEWPVKKLGELSSQINSGNTPKGGQQVYVDRGITFFRSQNVWKNKLEMYDIAYIDEATHASMSRSSLKHGDILMTKTGRINTENSSLGRAALYMGKDDVANVNGHVYFIRLKPGINNKFILRILISDEYRDYIRSVCVGGIDKRQLNKEHIEDFPIICPPVNLIEKYIAFTEQADKSKLQVYQNIVINHRVA